MFQKGSKMTIILLLISWFIVLFIDRQIALGYGISIVGIVLSIFSAGFKREYLSTTVFSITLFISLGLYLLNTNIGIGAVGGIVAFFIISKITLNRQEGKHG